MSFYILCITVVCFYAVLLFFDSFFKSCMHYPYHAFLEGTGLSVGLLNFSWITTAFNRAIFRLAKNLSSVLKKWFTFGYLITIFLFLPFSLWTLFSMVFDQFFLRVSSEGTRVEALVPGVNVPTSEVWVYFLAIGLSSVLHELGHALAAVQEDVQVLSVGVYVFAIIPIAFVQLNTEHLLTLPVGKKLRIYCAGIWHNIVLAFFALLLYFLTPILLSFAYQSDIGVRVVKFEHDSPLNYARGLELGDTVLSVNGCDIKNKKDWSYCLHMAYDRYGICTSSDFIALNDESLSNIVKKNGVLECCSKDKMYSFCFEYADAGSGHAGEYTCLEPREIMTDDFIKCTESSAYVCPEHYDCIKPSLNNHTYLISIKRKNNNQVLYLGLPYDIQKTVIVDQYFPRLALFSHLSPQKLEMFLRYVFMLSLGIGFLNVLPCYGTDGFHIAKTLIQLLARCLKKDDKFVRLVTIVTVVWGTLLTVPTLLYLFYKAIYLGD